MTEKKLEKIGKAFREAKALAALGDIQTASLLNGTSEISEAEIEKEIKAVRKIRKKH